MGHRKRHHFDRTDSRREQFTADRPRAGGPSWNAVIVTAGLVFLGVAIYVGTARSGGGATAGALLAPRGDVRLAVSDFDDGQARFYRYTSASGREIRFFVMKSADGVLRAAFDACDVCFRERRGYRQQGDLMVCNNCDQAFRSVDINVLRGGCNPAPIDRTIDGDQLVLTAASLEQGAAYF